MAYGRSSDERERFADEREYAAVRRERLLPTVGPVD